MSKMNIFSALSNETREKILRVLANKPSSFMELSRAVNISSSKLNFHLKKMEEILITKENGKYRLTESGRIACSILSSVELFPITENEVKLASIGMVIKPDDIDFNIKKALEIIDLTSSQGISLACLPFISISQPISIERIARPFKEKAKDLGIYISLGLNELEDEKRYHSTAFIKPDGNIGTYRGLHKNILAHAEIEVGDNIVICDTKFGKIGLTCGNEYLYPELFRVLRLRGADYVICPTFGIPEKFRRLLHSILITRAIENQVVVAFSSSGFFQDEALAIIHAPCEDTRFSSSGESISVRSIDLSDVQRAEEIFKNFLPGRAELYKELTTRTSKFKSNIAVQFPIKEFTRRYSVQSEDVVEIQEVTVFEKPLYLNVPVTSYCEGVLPAKKVQDIKWFDSFGTLDAVITKKEPLIHFLAPNRLAIMPGKFYSIGFQCKSSDLIEVKRAKIFLNLGFEDVNTLLSTGFEVGKVTVELSTNPKFEVVTSVPTYSNVTSSKTGRTFMWEWSKPREIPSLRIELKKE